MSVYDYMSALKMGKREYRSATSAGEYPYLPVLDDILRHVEIEKDVSLGLVQIPLNRVVGTSTQARTSAFARNFMPLLEYGTEFGAKWASLSDAQLEEGIRDPIEVIEYLNQYYVVEGNKRVSVLKFFDAVTVMGNVVRKIPKLTDDIEIKIYYEFMEFNRITGVNFMYVTQLGFFPKLLDLTGTKPEDMWDEDQRKDFFSFYLSFRAAYEGVGGRKLPITTGDAMTAFLTIYGYEASRNMSSGQLRESIVKIWNEFVMLAQDESVDIVMNPKSRKGKKPILNYLLPTKDKKLKVAFVYDKTPEQSDWIYAHELGRLYLEDSFKEEIETIQIADTTIEEHAEPVLEEIVSQGTDIIFTVTPQLMKASLKVAIDHPEVKILNCSLNTPHRYIRTYYGRMYEAKFLTGIIAGAMADNDCVGYLAEYPIFGAISNINAFALGAKLVNPRAKVYLQWSTVKDADVGNAFVNAGIKYLSGQDFITPQSASREFGLYCRGENGPINMAMPVWHWGVFYERLIQSILSGSWKRDGQESQKAFNYWWGMSAGVIDLICSNNVPIETRRLVEWVKDSISKNQFHPFETELRDQNGDIRNQNGRILTPEEIMTMDWLLDNVVGTIPTLEDLVQEARPVVEIVGVHNAED